MAYFLILGAHNSADMFGFSHFTYPWLSFIVELLSSVDIRSTEKSLTYSASAFYLLTVEIHLFVTTFSKY